MCHFSALKKVILPYFLSLGNPSTTVSKSRPPSFVALVKRYGKAFYQWPRQPSRRPWRPRRRHQKKLIVNLDENVPPARTATVLCRHTNLEKLEEIINEKKHPMPDQQTRLLKNDPF